MMKIAYVAEVSPNWHLGVYNKILTQADSWRRYGHDVRVFIVSHESLSAEKIKHVSLFHFPYIGDKPGRLLKYLNRILVRKRVENAMCEFSPDIIYYRQNVWYPGLCSLLKIAPCIMEINTVDNAEMKLMGKVAALYYRFGKRKLLYNISGYVCVTAEIASYYSDKKCLILANGYNLPTAKFPTKQKKGNERTGLIFVGSPGMVWHGVDKVILMAKLLPEFDFHIVGGDIVAGSELPNVHIYGYLKGKPLHDLYQICSVGIGTLALHRKGMTEACPLKVREYLAYGLPVIAGYLDTDLEGEDICLNIGNYEDNVLDNIGKIREFVLMSEQNEIDPHRVENLVGNHFKEQKRLEYLKKMIVDC